MRRGRAQKMCDRIMDTDSLRPFIGLRRAEKPDQKQAEIEAQDQEQGDDQRVVHTRILPSSLMWWVRG